MRRTAIQTRAIVCGQILNKLKNRYATDRSAELGDLLNQVCQSGYLHLGESWIRPLMALYLESVETRSIKDTEEFLNTFIRASQRANDQGDNWVYLFHSYAADELPREKFNQKLASGQLALHIAIEANSDRAIQQYLSLNPEKFGQHTPHQRSLGSLLSSWVLLIEAGRSEEAASMIHRWWSIARPYHTHGLVYTADLHDGIEDVAEHLAETPEIALFARVILASLPDPDPESEESEPGSFALPSRSERLRDLSYLAAETSFKNQSIEKSILSVLATEKNAWDLIGSRVTEISSNLLLFEPDASAEERYASNELILKRLEISMQNGSYTKVIEAVRQFQQASEEHRSEKFASTFTQLISIINDNCLKNIQSKSSKDQHSIFELLFVTIKAVNQHNTYSNWESQVSNPISMAEVLTLSVLLQNSKKTNARLGLFSDEEIEDALISDSSIILEKAAEILTLPNDTDPTNRIQGVFKIFQCQPISEIIDDDDWVFNTMLDMGLLTEEELLEHGYEIAELIGDNGWLNLGRAASEADGANADALAEKAWERAMALQETSRAQLRLIRLMTKFGSPDLALKYLDTVDPSTSDERRLHQKYLDKARSVMGINPESKEQEPELQTSP